MAQLQRSRSIRRFLPVLSALLGLLVATSGCSASPSTSGDLLDRVGESGTLRVANTQAHPPWNFVDSASQPVGYDVDVANELARRLGIPRVEFLDATRGSASRPASSSRTASPSGRRRCR